MVGIGMILLLTQKLSAPLSLGINAILLQLVLHKSPKEIGMYKYLLCYISVFETIFAFLNVLIQPGSFQKSDGRLKQTFQEFFSHSSVFLVVVRTDRMNLPVSFIYSADSLFCGMFGMSMALFALHFIYRYLVVTGNPYVKTITCQKLIVWLVCPLLYGALWITVVLLTLNPNQTSDAILSENFLPGKDIVMQEITYVGPNYYTDDYGNETLNWMTVIGMAVLDTMVTTSIIIIIIFATKSYKVVSALSQSFNHSKSYRDLQAQLLNSLVAQVIIPAILMQTPALYLFTAPILHLGNELAGKLFCTAVAIYPVLDPLPTLFMIQHYRKALLEAVSTKRQVRALPKRQQSVKSISANIANVEN